MTGKSELEEQMKNMDWELFEQQKEWLFSQQLQIQKWYGEAASDLPAGILNMMERIQDAWEADEQRTIANPCWYIEKWCDEDLEMALREAGLEATKANVARLKQQCMHIFDDKSERNEVLVEMARSF